MKGKIKTLLTQKKCGFILGEDGNEYFFHASSLKNAEYDSLRKGDEVTFEDSEGEKGLRAEDVFV